MEGKVLNSSMLRACALLTTASVMCSAAVSQAGLFDRFKAKPRRTTTVASASTETMRRGQSPVAEPGAVWQQPAGAGVSTPWYSDPSQSGASYGNGECCMCGPEDRCSPYTKKFRKKCDQTYYPPVPPYCFPCYGYNPTCWRRMQECAICPREEPLPPPLPRTPKVTPPKVESTPTPPKPVEPPEPMDDPSAMRLRSKGSRVTATRSQQATPPSTSRSRWTSYTDALPDDKDDEIPETPADTLEEMIEADDDAQLETPVDGTDALSDEPMADDELEAADEELEAVER